ncbi:MAG: 30S ribosome-binding factor RbfA [Sutterella sp.]|nr:30S ribosome-binding factor RbfA [Sutterella sp.]
MKETKPGRSIRIADQIARDLAEIIPRELRDPRIGLVTITGCEITPDYAHARVFFTVLGTNPEDSEAGLNAAAGHLRNLIFRKMTIHTVPTLHFVHDTSVAHGFAMDRVIREAMEVTRAGEQKAGADSLDHGK